MLSKGDLLKALAEITARDTRLLDDEGYADGTLSRRDDRGAVREMAEAMSAVYRGFDYTKSPEFRAQVADKPESFVAQRRRLASDPILLAEHRLRLKNALGALLTSREAYQLVPEDQHPRLRRIVTLAYNLANPGGEFRR